MAVKGTYVYDWPRPMVTVDAAVFQHTPKGWEILLIQRGRDPFQGKWALPGGFLELDEELESGAARELKEETGLEGIDLEQLHAIGTIGRDPRGRLLTVVYWGISRSDQKPCAGDDASLAHWFPINRLPEMAFDHADIVAMATRKLLSKCPEKAK
ncbi:MAG: NUDIX hydrolase [Anaerohalosphaeraceae bacterium]